MLLASVLLPAINDTAQAASATWNTSGGDWSTGANWTPNTAGGPGVSGTGSASTDIATFNNGGAGSTIGIVDSATTRNVKQIVFENSGNLGNFTIGSGSNTLYFNNSANASSGVGVAITATSTPGILETIASNIVVTSTNGAQGSDLRIVTADGFSGTLRLSGNIASSATSGISGVRIVTGTSANSTAQNNNVIVLSGIVSDGINGGKVAISRARNGVLVIEGANTYSGGFTQGIAGEFAANVTRIGVDSIGSVGAISSSAFGTGTITLVAGSISSSGASARTVFNTMTFANSNAGVSLGDVTNTGILTFAGGINLNTAAASSPNTATIITRSDVRFSGNVSNGNASPTNIGHLAKYGAATLTLSGTNTYTGNTSVLEGTLQFAKVVSLYSGSTANWTATKLAVDAGATAAFNVGGAGEFTAADIDALKSLGTGSGGFKNGSFLGLDTTSGNFTYASAIANSNSGSNALGLKKLGANTLTLSGSNTYSGGTTVNAGTLLINNAAGSGAGSGSVVVNNGGSLGGTGAFSGAVTINTGGSLRPGASIETLGSGSLAFNNGSTFEYEVDSGAAPSVGADLQKVSGSLALGGTVTLTLTDIAGAPAAFAQNTTFSLINYSGAWNGGLFTVDGNAIGDGGIFTLGLNTWQMDYNAIAGGSNFTGEYAFANFVNITAVPEPGTLGMLAAGSAIMCLPRRFRKKTGMVS